MVDTGVVDPRGSDGRGERGTGDQPLGKKPRHQPCCGSREVLELNQPFQTLFLFFFTCLLTILDFVSVVNFNYQQLHYFPNLVGRRAFFFPLEAAAFQYAIPANVLVQQWRRPYERETCQKKVKSVLYRYLFQFCFLLIGVFIRNVRNLLALYAVLRVQWHSLHLGGKVRVLDRRMETGAPSQSQTRS